MSYIINKTNGSVLTEVVDGTIDQTASDVTLVGKNASSYGEVFNENFIKLLENFANTSMPNYPIQGQLWYDTSEARLKVYDGTGFKVSGGTIVTPVIPSTIAQGDIWIDSFRQQMYFNDGVGTLLAGPIYTQQQGISGFQAIDILDNNSINHTVVLLYVSQTLMGIFAKESFTPLNPIAGHTGDIEIGFNVGSYSGIKFKVPVTQADALVGDGNVLKTASSFLSSTDNTRAYGTVTIANTTPLILGVNQNNEIKISTDDIQINSNIINQDFKINVLNSNGPKSAIVIDAENERIGIFTTELSPPSTTLDVNGNIRIRGDMLVEGSTSTINTTNLAIEDAQIELAKTDAPDDDTANGGGIRLIASSDQSSDKLFTWTKTTTAWTSTENLDLITGKSYSINGSPLLDALTVYSYYAPNLESIGTLTSLQVDDIYINGNTISYVNSTQGAGSIYLAPKSPETTGTVDVSMSRISSLQNPVDLTDAVNKQTLLNTAKTVGLGLSANINGLDDATIAATIINKIYPASVVDDEHREGTICRIWGVDTGTAKKFSLVSGAWIFQADL
jgi:hypothetical protein